MRIALISEHASPLAVIGGVDSGGQNVHVAELAAGLVRQGHAVAVYTRRDSPQLRPRVTTGGGYDVVHVPAGPPCPLPKDELWAHMPEFAQQLWRRLRADRPDLLHAHFWMSAWAAIQVSEPLRLPVLVTFHALGSVKRRHQGQSDTSPPERIATEALIGTTCDHIIATCHDEVGELARLGVRRDRTSVVPCGVDIEHFTPGPGDDTGWKLSRSAPYRLVSAGRRVPRKGVGSVVEALSELPDVELVIAGGDGPTDAASNSERERLAILARQHGGADRVRFVGRMSRGQMVDLLRSADVVVCTPWYEPFGIVPLEAMACGVPVVGSAVGGMLDTVVDSVTGALVRPRDPVALAEVVGPLLESPSRRAEFARAALERVRSCYSWNRVAADTAAVYQQTVRRQDVGQALSAPLG